MKDLQFSPKTHFEFCKGYLDALGKAHSTDKTLYGFTLRSLEESSSIAEILGSDVSAETPIANISSEWESTLADVLKTPSDRLSWYASEYLDWFQRNVPESSWYKLEHEKPDEATLKQYAYLLRIPDEDDRYLIATVRKKVELDA